MDQEINDILFMEERELEKKEREMEEFKKKIRKPRPRDVVDFESLKRGNQTVMVEDNLGDL